MRRSKWAKPLILVAGAIGVIAMGCERSVPPSPDKSFAMPSPSQVKSIHIQAWQPEEPSSREFDVVDHVETILTTFEPNQLIPQAAAWKVHCSLRVNFKDERTLPLLISVYQPGGAEF